MTRKEFMKSLMKYLKNISYEEKKDIDRYYSEMFDDAEISDDDIVPKSFGNPKNIALDVLTDLYDKSNVKSSAESDSSEKYKRKNTWLIILLAIIAAPIGIPLALGIAITILALIFSFGITVLALGFTTIVTFIAAFASDVTLVTRVFFIGFSLAMAGVVILIFELFKFIIVKLEEFISRKLRERRAKNEKEY